MNRRLLKKSLLLRLFVAPMIVAMIISSGFIGALNQANAALKATAMTPEEKIESALLYRSVGICLKNAGLRDGDGVSLSRIKESNAKIGAWFNDRANGKEGVAPIGAYMRDTVQKLPGVGDDYKLDCDQPEFILKALNLWKPGENGADNGLTLLCNAGFVRTNHKDDTPASCIAGTGDLERKADYSNFNTVYGAQGNDKSAGLYESYIGGLIYNAGGSTNPIDGWNSVDWYWYYTKTFNWSCGYGKMKSSQALKSEAEAGGGDKAYNIWKAQNDGTVTKSQWYVGLLAKTESVIVRPNDARTNQDYTKTCEFIAGQINRFAQDYATYSLNKVVTANCTAKGYKTPDLVPCINGGINRNSDGTINALYCADTYKTDPALAACKAGATTNVSGSAEEAASTTGVDKPGTADQPCEIDGALGWVICPAIRFLAGVSDGVFTFLADSLLKVDPKILASGTANPTYNAWIIMRNVANVAFVIVFLIIIFSQLTGAGITNYGVKKMLPRLVIAAILVNLSYFVCQIAVDLSNILGYSVKGALDAIGENIASVNAVVGQTNASNPDFVGMTNSALGQAGSVLLLLSILIPIMIAGLIAIIIIVFMLIGRQAILVMLIVISPLAFVAFLLPNTQNLFTQWRKIFTTLLMMFPIISAVFGLSSLTSTILAGAFTENADGGVPGFINQILAAGVLVLPLFLVPMILKKSLDGIGSIGAAMNAAGNKARSGANAVKGAGKSLAKTGANAGLGRLANTKFGASRGGRILGGIASGKGRRGFSAMGEAHEAQTNKNIQSQWQRDGTYNNSAKLESIAKSKPNSSEGRAAMHALSSKGDANELSRVRRHLDSTGNTEGMKALQRATDSNFSALKAKNPSAVQPMKHSDWGNLKAVETFGMKDEAITEGIASSPQFAQTVKAAALDPLTARNYSADTIAWAKGGVLPGGGSTSPAGQANHNAAVAAGMKSSSGGPANIPGGGNPIVTPGAGAAPAQPTQPLVTPASVAAATAASTSTSTVGDGSRRVVTTQGAPTAGPTIVNGMPTGVMTATSTASAPPTTTVTMNSSGGRRVTTSSPSAAAPTTVAAPAAQAENIDLQVTHDTAPAAPVAFGSGGASTTPSKPSRRVQSTDGAFIVNGGGETTVAIRQAPVVSAADSQASARAAAVAAAKNEQSGAGARGSSADSSGFRAPNGAGDDYQDGMNK
ncbi:MAG: hypothetical protein ABIP50_00715 [Candidatus Saccharimonadales bacterium]